MVLLGQWVLDEAAIGELQSFSGARELTVFPQTFLSWKLGRK